MRRQEGFTLVELLTTMVIITSLSAIGFFAFRHYWLARALDGSRNEVVTQLRELQQRAQSQSHPLVFGARFSVGSDEFSTVRYNPTTGVCAKIEDIPLAAGVRVSEVTFTTFPGVTPTCQSQLGTGSYVFFFARGSATAGSLTLRHASLDDRSRGLTVGAVTGRVEEFD